MRTVKQLFILAAFAGLIGIQFTTLIDDPRHLIEPDPNCPLCIASKTEICLAPHISVPFSADIIVYLTEQAAADPLNNSYPSILSIRAPPFA